MKLLGQGLVDRLLDGDAVASLGTPRVLLDLPPGLVETGCRANAVTTKSSVRARRETTAPAPPVSPNPPQAHARASSPAISATPSR
eukprot:8517456-Pyramimonas_sp.AAC.1